LFVVLIPGLLMLATFGLERVESRLNCDAVSAADVAEFLAQAQADDVGTLAREGMPEALDCLHRRRSERTEPAPEVFLATADLPRLPTRLIYRQPN
jgi:hypothetical protein